MRFVGERGQLEVARDRLSSAVVPFQNLTGDPEQEYFSDRIVEEIVTGGFSSIIGAWIGDDGSASAHAMMGQQSGLGQFHDIGADAAPRRGAS